MRYGPRLAASAAVLALVVLATRVHEQSLYTQASGSGAWTTGAMIIAPFVLCALALVPFFKRVIEPPCARWLALDGEGKKRARVGAYIGAVGMFPVVLLPAVVVGGSFGGAIGSLVLPDVGPIIGVGTGIFVVTFLATAFGSAMGLIIAGYLARRPQ